MEKMKEVAKVNMRQLAYLIASGLKQDFGLYTVVYESHEQNPPRCAWKVEIRAEGENINGKVSKAKAYAQGCIFISAGYGMS